jgi:hypothetical protein
MSVRTALVGPFESLRLNVTDDSVNVEPFLKELPRLDVPALWYSCVLQAGIERLDIASLDFPENVTPPKLTRFLKRNDIFPPTLSKRVAQVDTPELESIFYRVQFCLGSNLELPAKTIRKKAPLLDLQAFLVELLLAAQRKQNLVCFGRLPQVSSLESILPVDFFLPFKNLLQTLERSVINLPAVKGSLSIQDINLFEQIIVGHAFRRYEQHHTILDENRRSIERAVQAIEKETRHLVTQNPRLLRTKHAIISLLPISAKIIDTIFGKLPGDLAEFCTKWLTEWLKDNKRIVIYEFADLREMTLRSRLKELEAKKINHSNN